MASNEEIIQQFRQELERIVRAETRPHRERWAAIRAEFLERLNELERELEGALSPIVQQAEAHIQSAVIPVVSSQVEAEAAAPLRQQLEELAQDRGQRELENAQLREHNARLQEQLSQRHEELSALNDRLEQATREREELDSLRENLAQQGDQVASLSQELSRREEAVSRLKGERAELEQRISEVVEEYAQAKAGATRATRAMLERLKSSLDHVEAKKSQVDILTAFLDEASHYATRVALFVAKGDTLWGWRAHGFFSAGFSDAEIKSLHFSLSSDTLLRQAFVEKRPLRSQRGSHPENRTLLERLGYPLKDSFVAIPLVVKERSTAVVYADGGSEAEGEVDFEGLELLVRLVALLVELLAYRARASMAAKPGIRIVTSPPPGPAAVAEKESAPLATVSASGSAEVEGSEKSAPPLAPPIESTLSEDEQELKLHKDAKRFARLLISEIKLYNEQKVLTGRRNKDLYDRLKDEIDRSRQMYAKRVSPLVASKVDYFYDELVRTLGENDPSTLGSDCPGPILLSAPE